MEKVGHRKKLIKEILKLKHLRDYTTNPRAPCPTRSYAPLQLHVCPAARFVGPA